jgi:hypothetical protein
MHAILGHRIFSLLIRNEIKAIAGKEIEKNFRFFVSAGNDWCYRRRSDSKTSQI